MRGQSVQEFLRHLGAFVRLVLQEYGRHQAAQNAASLTFATLLALVPLMAVSLAVLYAFPVADRVHEAIQNWLFSNFVPASGEMLLEHLQEFTDKASKLSGTGSAFLLIVALMLMSNIDRALNTIWGAPKPRRWVSKFLIYWAVLTLGPVLIGVSVAVTSYLTSLPFLSDAVASGAASQLLSLTPVVTSALAFSLMYAVIPNVRVRLKHAVIGGLLAALLFEVAKQGFAAYVTAFPTYEAIYGAMAMVPIFLVWIYLCWTVTLVGAEVAHCLRLFNWQSGNPHGRELGFVDALQVLLTLDEAAAEGRALSAQELASQHRSWREDRVEHLLGQLQTQKAVHQTREGDWSLARRLLDLSLADVQRMGGYRLPSRHAEDWPQDARLGELFERVMQQRDALLDVPLADFRQARERGAALSAVK